MSVRKNKVMHRGKRFIKRLMPQTLFGRSLLILITPVFLIQLITTIVFFDRHWERMTARLSYAIAGETLLIAELVESKGYNAPQVQRFLSLSQSKLGVSVAYSETQKVDQKSVPDFLPLSWDGMIRSSLINELVRVTRQNFEVQIDAENKRVEIALQLDRGVLMLSFPQRRLFSSTSYIFLIWGFCTSTILLIIAVLFMRNQIRPIKRLAHAAERFGRGHEVAAFKTEGAREVRLAGQAFIDMKERIKRQISQRTEMLAGVSHDLRTPLTRLKLQISMMGDGPDIYEMKRDVVEMERMIDGYLNFVRGEGLEAMKREDLSAMLRDLASGLKRQGKEVSMDVPDTAVIVDMRPVAFKRAISNITSNAAKYAKHIWITLAMHTDEGRVKIIIEDNGPGIPADHYEDVFRPFYRVDSSRNIDTGGVGLGMPITMDIVHSHGGEIWLEKSQHDGLAVHILLPC